MQGGTQGAVIIVGGGITGIVAALELLRAGRPVVLFDRDGEAHFGGQARASFGGILAVDTPVQRRHGIHDSPERALEDWLRFGELTPQQTWPYRWARAYVHECRAEVYEWLQAHKVRFLPMPQWPERRGNSLPRWHVVWGTGQHLTLQLIAALRAEAQARPGGLELHFGHRVERLLRSGSGVDGVAGAREADGAPFERRGAAVLVATGGVGGDPELVRSLWPRALGPAPRHLLIGAHRYADGLLHRECEAAGAVLGDLGTMWNYAAGVHHWRPRQPLHGLSLVPPRSAAWLDAAGQRFAPPLVAGWDTREQVARVAASGGYSWLVLNRKIARRELAVSGAEFNAALRDRRPFAFLRDLLLGNAALVDTLVGDCEDVVAAPTVDALVTRMRTLLRPGDPPLDAQAVAAGLAAFDAARLGPPGADAQWDGIRTARAWKGDRLRTARPSALLDPRAGPLIAVRAHLISRKTLAGIATDLEGQALAADGSPVPGLYAAGEASGFGGGGMNGVRALEGTFLGGCIYSARRAARGIVGAQGPDAGSAGARRKA